MDNKQNRQFYWQVKDFLNKKQEPVATPPNSLKKTIQNVTNKTTPVPAPINEIVNSSSSLKDQTKNLLSSYQNALNKQKPVSDKSSSHITANIFRIKK
jgi:hypothetical protein